MPSSNTVSLDAIERILREQHSLLGSTGVGIAFVQQQEIVSCNDRCAEIFGHSGAQEMLGRHGASLHPDEKAFQRIGRMARVRMARGLTFRTECQLRRHDGALFWGGLTGRLLNPVAPEEGSIWTLDDIDEQRQAQALLSTALREKQLLFDHASVGIIFMRRGHLTRCNGHFETMLGYGPGELIGTSARNWFASAAEWERLEQSFTRQLGVGLSYEGEMMLSTKDGGTVICEVRCKLIDASDPDQGTIWITVDITERTQAQAALAKVHEQLEQQVRDRTRELSATVEDLHREMADRKRDQDRIYWLAHYDPLTGLPNRTLLADRSTQAIQLARDNGTPLAAIFLDLDHFKHVNDSLGHRVGDTLLVQIAKRLRSVVREKDTVSRIGGDEFVLLLPGANAHGAARVAAKLLEASRQPYQIDHHELTMAPSMGIALYPQDGMDFDTLTQSADVAMYHAKLDGRNTFRFFTPEMRAQSLRALQLENALRRALERDELQLHYQPQVRIRTGRVHSVEALLRWNHPKLGPISPAEFIPVAEDTGQILQIGEWVLRSAVRQLKVWRLAGLSELKVAVNLSAIQFHQPQLPDLVSQILHAAAVPPDALELELTEGVAVNDPRTATETMDQLRSRGVRLSIDDFGTGYSSLSQLKRFQIYKLKIDQSFVQDLDHDGNDRAIVSAIIRMAQALGMQTTAEGVETEAQLQFLRDMGCDEAQGYYFSRPLPPGDDLLQFLRSRQAPVFATPRL